jgi:hypothetical protein
MSDLYWLVHYEEWDHQGLDHRLMACTAVYLSMSVATPRVYVRASIALFLTFASAR